jgi:hypothetical protein
MEERLFLIEPCGVGVGAPHFNAFDDPGSPHASANIVDFVWASLAPQTASSSNEAVR